MIWIILMVLFLALFIYSSIAVQDGGGVVAAIGTFFIIFGGIFISALYSGTSDLPWLNGKYKSIQLARVRVNDVRNAYYKNESKATLIAGSIENVKQSTTLSEAIRSLTNGEVEYIKKRENILFAKDSLLYWWFLDGFFIPDKVKETPELQAQSL